jgi:hypothetical protein
MKPLCMRLVASRLSARFDRTRRPLFGHARRATVPHLDWSGIGALSRMGKVLGEKDDRDVVAGARFACWNDV